MTDVPNPGSDAALVLGCKCPVYDNARGRGYMGGATDKNGETVFVISFDCKLHYKPPREPNGRKQGE